ncbi:MAG: LysE family transporter [Limisphaerales bacterium]
MPDLPPTLLAAVAGFVTALIFSSIPFGPVNLTIINEGAQRGFKWAMLIGLGAATMEVIYSAIAFTGFSSFFDKHLIATLMKVLTFIFLLVLGIKFLMAKKVAATTQLGSKAERLEGRIEEKLRPHSAFAIGLVRVMGNIGVLATWLVIAAYLMSHEAFFSDQYWVADTFAAKTACVTGVTLGTLTWFFGLSFGISRTHGQISEKALLKMQHFSGICLIVLAIFDGVRMVWHLSHHKL